MRCSCSCLSITQVVQQPSDGVGHHAAGRPSLLIVDSLSFLVSPVLGPGGADDGHALMICLGRALKQLAQTQKLAVISTNHIVGGAFSSRRTSFAAYQCHGFMSNRRWHLPHPAAKCAQS